MHFPTEQAVEKADAEIMELCAPERMAPAEAIEFLVAVRDRINDAIEGLREEHYPEIGEP